MSFFLEIKSNTVKCPNGCKLFNDKRNFSYWESKNVTKDEKYIVDYLNINSEVLKNKNILHVGIGNSYIAKKLLSYNKIDGISLSQNELDYASKLNLPNYNFFFQNKKIPASHQLAPYSKSIEVLASQVHPSASLIFTVMKLTTI